MIEEHVNKLAELQAELKAEEMRADDVSVQIDHCIRIAEDELNRLKVERIELRQPFTDCIDETQTNIGDLYNMIIDEWTGENKTIVFDAGTLKFTSRGSLKILDERWLLADILDRTSIEDVAEKYINSFNLTAVKKYMGVHELPIDVAEITYKTTVKLENSFSPQKPPKSGWTVPELEQGYKSG